MGSEVNVVKSGAVLRDHIKYDINQHEIEGEVKFDWLTDVGAESEEWFNSIEEAERDVRDFIG